MKNYRFILIFCPIAILLVLGLCFTPILLLKHASASSTSVEHKECEETRLRQKDVERDILTETAILDLCVDLGEEERSGQVCSFAAFDLRNSVAGKRLIDLNVEMCEGI